MGQILSRNLFSLGKFVMLVWLVVLASQTGTSQRKANCELSIFGSLKVDVCGNENQRRFILVMNIGNVLPSDSLFGFNFQISYDKEKVKITDALYLNTLSEFFDTKAVSINSSQGKINGYAILMGMQPVYGNRPLIAFNGLWISNCPDTASFIVDYIEFTDEFKISIDSLKPAILLGEIFTSKDRIFQIEATKDTIVNQENSFVFDVDVKVPKLSRLDQFDLKVFSNYWRFVVDSVQVLGNDYELLGFEILSGDILDTFKLTFKINFDSGRVNTLRFFSKVFNENNFVKVLIEPEFDSFCKCVNNFVTDSIVLFYEYEKPNLIQIENNDFNIDSEYLVMITDLMGKLISKFNIKSIMLVENELKNMFLDLSKGTYFVIYMDKNLKVIKREIYVNY